MLMLHFSGKTSFFCLLAESRVLWSGRSTKMLLALSPSSVARAWKMGGKNVVIPNPCKEEELGISKLPCDKEINHIPIDSIELYPRIGFSCYSTCALYFRTRESLSHVLVVIPQAIACRRAPTMCGLFVLSMRSGSTATRCPTPRHANMCHFLDIFSSSFLSYRIRFNALLILG